MENQDKNLLSELLCYKCVQNKRQGQNKKMNFLILLTNLKGLKVAYLGFLQFFLKKFSVFI